MKWHPGKGNSNITTEFQWFLPPSLLQNPVCRKNGEINAKDKSIVSGYSG